MEIDKWQKASDFGTMLSLSYRQQVPGYFKKMLDEAQLVEKMQQSAGVWRL